MSSINMPKGMPPLKQSNYEPVIPVKQSGNEPVISSNSKKFITDDAMRKKVQVPSKDWQAFLQKSRLVEVQKEITIDLKKLSLNDNTTVTAPPSSASDDEDGGFR